MQTSVLSDCEICLDLKCLEADVEDNLRNIMQQENGEY
jgi:hypothetical protein